MEYQKIINLVDNTTNQFKGTVSNTGTAAAPNNRNKDMLFQNCAPFTNFIS